jgi:predicted DNA-binding protein with PD1-like motif
MNSRENNNIIFIRLFPNEDLKKKLKEACRIHDVKNAIILSGLGQLKNIKLGFFKKDKYIQEYFSSPYELLGLTGSICKKYDDYLLHLHTILGNNNFKTIGGHLIEGKVEITNEIVLMKTDVQLYDLWRKNSNN